LEAKDWERLKRSKVRIREAQSQSENKLPKV